MEIFGQLSSSEFFQNYWQQRPILFRNALPDFISPVTADELAGLACEEETESRLVLEKGGEKPWQVISGPFNEKRLTNLPDSNWSLSVQGVDRILPEVSSLLKHFKFIPNWLLDDILVSYAPDCGSVGAHIDNYDVFIIQAQGRRAWLLGGQQQWNEQYQEGLDIRLLAEFEPEYQWELESGDVLYIPKRFAHHGIAIGECLNYSVGFRAPTDGELIRSLATWSIEQQLPEQFYNNPNLNLQESPGEISAESLKSIRGHMKTFIDSAYFNQWFGQHITEPKAFFVPPEKDSHLSSGQFKDQIDHGALLVPAEGLKRSWINANPPMLFLEGENIQLPTGTNPELLRLICDSEEIFSEQILNNSNGSQEIWEMWSEIHNKGYFSIK